MRVLKKRKSIEEIHKKTIARAAAWQKFFRGAKNLKLHIKNQGVRSVTVLTLTGNPERIAEIKKLAKESGFLLGDGYGALKPTTFRIANFPAIRNSETKKLMQFLKKYK